MWNFTNPKWGRLFDGPFYIKDFGERSEIIKNTKERGERREKYEDALRPLLFRCFEF